ncbi:MAG: shikimate kinase [Clostridiales bacterium]|nr:shikimate kinase [Clostridiales bacterium]
MAGSGKSTLGVLLAKTLGMPFIDTDLIIQEREGKLLQDIIDSDGVTSFIKIEENAVLSILVEGTVIATGGSVVYSSKAIMHLKEKGILIYLDLDFDEIEKRIKNMTTRGIAMEKGKTLRNIYDERIPLYEKYADIIVDCNGKTMEENLEEIVKELKDRG